MQMHNKGSAGVGEIDVCIGENGNVSRVYRLLSLVIKDANIYAIP